MNMKLGVLMILAVFAVLLSILALQGLVGGEWNTISQFVASVIFLIAVLAFIIAVVVGKG